MRIATDELIVAISLDAKKIVEKVVYLSEIDLVDSECINDLIIDAKEKKSSIILEMLWNDYAHYLRNGRKPMQSTQPPISALRDWTTSKGLPSHNGALFALSRAIWEQGQEPRPLLAILKEKIEEKSKTDWQYKLVEEIENQIAKYFN